MLPLGGIKLGRNKKSKEKENGLGETDDENEKENRDDSLITDPSSDSAKKAGKDKILDSPDKDKGKIKVSYFSLIFLSFSLVPKPLKWAILQCCIMLAFQSDVALMVI